jgi:16S rRNA (cytidine1402-2'-O)-methyltransferase
VPPPIDTQSVLYLVSTPIGNLADLSFRAVEVLKTCHYILCEDTRHSSGLLRHYGIETSLRAFHKFNEAKAEERVIEDLEQGINIALISDAGTPLISDPGHDLVLKCREKGIVVSAIPGACAVVNALVLSGFAPCPFQFIGFLPKKAQELQGTLAQALLYNGTTLAYESPHRIEETLSILAEQASQRKLCVARELTKLHEECLTGTASEILAHFQKQPPRGEIVLLISPPEEKICFEHLSLEELVEMLQTDLRMSKLEAIKAAAHLRQLPKREVYNLFVKD